MEILFTVAGTLLVLGAILGLKFSYQAWRLLQVNTEVLNEASQIIDAFVRQNKMAMQMMQGEGDEEESEDPGFGVNQD